MNEVRYHIPHSDRSGTAGPGDQQERGGEREHAHRCFGAAWVRSCPCSTSTCPKRSLKLLYRVSHGSVDSVRASAVHSACRADQTWSQTRRSAELSLSLQHVQLQSQCCSIQAQGFPAHSGKKQRACAGIYAYACSQCFPMAVTAAAHRFGAHGFVMSMMHKATKYWQDRDVYVPAKLKTLSKATGPDSSWASFCRSLS